MNTLEVRRRLLGRNVYKKTVEGNPAIAQGSLARRYPGIAMQGWTEQAQYEGNQLFDKVGIELSNMPQYIPVNVGDGEFTLSTDYVGAAYQRDIFFLAGNVESGAQSNTNGVQSGVPRTVASVDGYVTVAMRKQNDDDLNPENYQIMLNSGSTALPYEPYTGGQPSPNPDYPQEIVSAGKYDEGTGKYQYEITLSDNADRAQNLTLISDRPLTKWDKLEKRSGQWGWVYKSEEIESYTDESVPGEYYSTTGQLSVGAQVWYETATETFVPLSPEEQESMNALYTFRPTTVLSNDCECNMTLTYKTKKSMQSAPGGISKPSNVTSYFTFGVKWNQINKIVLKASGITEKQNIFFCGEGAKQPWIGLDHNKVLSFLGIKNGTCNLTSDDILDGQFHEMIFEFDISTSELNIVNVWDVSWSKNIIYHEIMFYDGDELLADYVPYYKSAGYMLDKKNNVVIRATNPDDYEFA